MKSHFELTDQEFEMKFDDLSLEPTLFSHEAHLRLAFIHIRKYGLDQAITNICDQIKTFDAYHGDGTKYHHTITVAAVQIMRHFMKKSIAKDFKGFISQNPRVITSFRELIYSHYSSNLLSDQKAKEEFLEPDLLLF